ncbi:MAG: hypothetical protein IKZ97_02355 [Butyrivibrio sp.]|nr:hypothetical protein [Butyrivibrio sp.]
MKKLTANWGLKLIALIIAAVVWLLVTTINDPVTTIKFANIPVHLQNVDRIEAQGQVCTVLDGSDTISSVTVYAPRSTTQSLSMSNIVATADVTDLSSLQTANIRITTNKASNQIVKIVPSSDVVKLSIEKKSSRPLQITATTSGNVEDGYMLGDVTMDQNMVRISGPESVVSSVKEAKIDIDVSGWESDIVTDYDISLYDAEGKLVDTSTIDMNIKSVRANVPILETKTVPVRVVSAGDPTKGYALTGENDCRPSQVLIAGKSNVLSNVKEIVIDSDELDVTGLKKNLTGTFDLSEFLPDGIVLADPDFRKHPVVAVVVHVGAITEQTLDVNIKNVSVIDSAEGYEVTVDESEYETLSLTLEGLQSKVNTLNPAELKGTVSIKGIMEDNNLTELSEGTYSAEVDWTLPKDIKVKNPVKVYIKVKKAD